MRSEYTKLSGEFSEPHAKFLEVMDSRLPLWKTLIGEAGLAPEIGEKFLDVVQKRVLTAREQARRPGRPVNYREEFTFGLLSDLLTAKGETIAAGASADKVIALTASLKGDIQNFISEPRS